MAPDPLGLADNLNLMDWLLRVANVIGLGVLFKVALKIGASETIQAQTVVLLADTVKDVKELSREVHELVGSQKSGRLSGPL